MANRYGNGRLATYASNDLTTLQLLCLEENLMLLKCNPNLNTHGGRETAIEVDEVMQWIFESDLRDDHPYSYASCCKAAGVDPEELRDMLGQVLDKLARRPPATRRKRAH